MMFVERMTYLWKLKTSEMFPFNVKNQQEFSINHCLQTKTKPWISISYSLNQQIAWSCAWQVKKSTLLEGKLSEMPFNISVGS